MTKIIMLELSLCSKNCVIKKYNVFVWNGSDVEIYSFMFFNPIYYFDDWITSLPLVMTHHCPVKANLTSKNREALIPYFPICSYKYKLESIVENVSDAMLSSTDAAGLL